MNLPDTFEPPLSTAPMGAPGDGLRRVVEPEAPAGPLATPPPLPNRLLRMGLVTLPQLTAAMQRQAETGMPLPDALIELGLISAEDLAALLADEQAPPAPADPAAPAPALSEAHAPLEHDAAPAAPAPEEAHAPLEHDAAPAVPAEPATQLPLAAVPDVGLALDPPASTVTRFAVVAQLEGASRVELGVYGDLPTASHVATEAMRAVRDSLSDWPLLGGRYVRPSSVVSIEVTALL
jgi:hypothetical protein